MNKLIALAIFSLLISSVLSAKKFTASDMHSMYRQVGTVLSPDGKYSVFSIRKWDKVSGKVSMNLQYLDMDTKKSNTLTDEVPGKIDSNPQFSESFPNTIFYLSNKSEDGSNQLWSIDLVTKVSKQITYFEVDIDNLKISKDAIVFSAEVYFDCIDLPFVCTSKRNADVAARGPNTWSVYTKMFVRHWDQWTTEGKGNHLFYAKLDKDAKITSVVDIMQKMEANSPIPPFGGSELFDISPDGKEVVYSAHLRTREESWTTKWETYLYSSADNSNKLLSENFKGRTQNPRFSPDGKSISLLVMPRQGLESDNLQLVIHNREANTFTNVTEKYDRSIVDYVWFNQSTVFFTAMDWNTNKIFSVDVTKNENNVKTIADGLFSYSTILFKDNLVVAIRSSFTTPDEMVYFNYDSTKDIQEVKKLYNANFSNLINFDLKDPEDFKFTGAKNEEQIQGFIFKPTKFEEGKKYPLAVLIHGGPEGGFEANWSFRWNPQVWTNAGYVVVMMNPHGSSGQGIAFQDAVRDDWGGVPYKDLKLGVEYVIKTYSYIDGDRKCAAGASYGGYMVNWIQGQTDINFNCLVTHDGVFSTVAMYYATEEIWFPHAEYCPFDAVGCKPWEDKYRQRYEIFSPESYVKNWRTPHLIIHGSKDFRIPVSEGLSAFTALQVKGIPSKFLHFYEENHWVLKAENSIKWYDEVIGWFDNYTAPKTVEDKTFFMEYLE